REFLGNISHELKTPISILVSNFERIEKETSIEKIQELIKFQKEDTKSLSDIINSLLEITKAETGYSLIQDKIRIDELIFDVSDELKNVYPNFQFLIEYSQENDENNLIISANIPLIKAALMNLMLNCIHYSSDKKGRILISCERNNLILSFENNGAIISIDESQFLFQHFFRGKNSKGKRGFGLGLVFIHKIITLHSGSVSYNSSNDTSNIFTISLPLS
ncbi:MAG: sensor histidine kinase, partial [Bacteroidetes bacterium HGW-Bacteroidetes-12]